MKKEYIKPLIKTVIINDEESILAGSTVSGGSGKSDLEVPTYTDEQTSVSTGQAWGAW